MLGETARMTNTPAAFTNYTPPPPTTPEFGSPDFVDRRQQNKTPGAGERRQFGNSYNNLSAPGKELAEAIDAYKVQNRRRYITTDELLGVLSKLGYSRS